MSDPKNYSAPVRAANSHTIISAAQFIGIIQGSDANYIKPYDWVEIENHIIIDFLNLRDVTTSLNLRIKDCYFEHHVSLAGATFEKMVSFIECRFEKNFEIAECEFKDQLEILGIHIPTLWINGGTFKEFVFRGYYDLFRFWIVGGKFKEFTFVKENNDKVLEEFVFYNKGALEGNVNLQNIEANKIALHGMNTATSELSFEDIKCDHFTISDFTNNGIIKIFGLDPILSKNCYFEVVKSNLGKAQVFRVAFKHFEEVIFVDSFLAEINIINCDWGNNFRGTESPNYYAVERDRPFFGVAEKKQLKESFRQLKFVYNKQGDKINESLFYSFEMNTYYSLIPWKAVRFKPWKESFWEKLIILGSKYLSNYGMSFFVPLVCLVLVNHGILMILIECYHYKGLSLAGFSLGEKEANMIAIGEFFKLINPVHKMDENLKGWAVFWDLFSRISASYFLYNLIRSSRRFLK